MRRTVLKKVVAGMLAGALAVSGLSMGSVPKVVQAADNSMLNLNGKYHATLGIQTATEKWFTHLGYYEKVQNKYFDTEYADKLVYADNSTGEDTAAEGTFTNVEIAGNGAYTLKLEDADFLGEQVISQLHIATDIPLNDTIKFKNVKAVINGRQVLSFDEGVEEDQEPYLQGGMVILLLNHWRPELIKKLKEEAGKAEDSENGWTLLQGSGKEKVEITFTVEGFAYDNPDAVEQEPTDTPAPAVDTSDKAAKSDVSKSSVPVVPIVVAVVVIAAAAVVVAVRKKK